MAATSQFKADLIKKYLRQYPDIASHTLASLINTENPNIWKDNEAVRSAIRYYRNAHGSKAREYVGERFESPFKNANEYYEKVKAKKIGIDQFEYPHTKPLILSDIHFPYHAEDELLIALEHGHKEGCDSIYLNGDVLDCHTISRFLKEGGAPSFNEEREMFWQFIEYVKSNWDVPIYYKLGNHEERWQHYLSRQVPELFDVADLRFENVMQFDKYGIVQVEARQKTQMGKLIVVHGHEFGESIFSPVNPARGLFLRAKSSVLAGHNHQTSEHHENNLKGDSLACFSTGCLCQLAPNYRPFAYTKWNHGFAIVGIDGDGSFEVDNYRIIDKKVR